jgi:ribonucleotide monophosphatase NagD (HAD superfamily)
MGLGKIRRQGARSAGITLGGSDARGAEEELGCHHVSNEVSIECDLWLLMSHPPNAPARMAQNRNHLARAERRRCVVSNRNIHIAKGHQSLKFNCPIIASCLARNATKLVSLIRVLILSI